jgi:oligopeptide/dipeptide ABC transporter ATP-binding protein
MLKIQELKTYFYTDKGVVKAVDGVSLDVGRGKILGLVGESGCGKSVTALSILKLVQCPPGKIIDGSIVLDGKDLLKMSPKRMREIRGNEISMIFQEPMTSLNPVYKVGRQVMEALMIHEKIDKNEARKKTVEMFEMVGIPEAEKRIEAYPHQLSGGLRQRVMIAMALICKPKLLIADEPTTALDVTIQAQILKLMKELQKETNASIILITHDLGVVAEVCDYVNVMYAGKIMEYADVFEIFESPLHPYTWGLLNSIPKLHENNNELYSIKGMVPSLLSLPKGCRFHPRCEFATSRCREEEPELVEFKKGHFVRCWNIQHRR